MVYMILCSIFFILFFEVDSWDCSGVLEKIGYFFLGAISGILVGFIVWITVGSLIGLKMPTENYTETKSLYALQDGEKISGIFYLMGGTVDQKQVIKYITDGELGKHIETQEAKNSYIKEGYSDPYLEIHKQRFKKDWYILFSMCWSTDKYVFYVPSGSVINEYDIDLE